MLARRTRESLRNIVEIRPAPSACDFAARRDASARANYRRETARATISAGAACRGVCRA
jgi:hypothetical protein